MGTLDTYKEVVMLDRKSSHELRGRVLHENPRLDGMEMLVIEPHHYTALQRELQTARIELYKLRKTLEESKAEVIEEIIRELVGTVNG